MAGLDLEMLRSILRDDKLHIMLALVKKVAVSDDRSVCRCMVSILPEQREMSVMMTWEAVGSEAGFFMLPSVNDLVLVGQVEGSKDDAYIIRRLTSKDDKIPLTAADGSFVLKSLAGKKVWITSDTRINLSKADTVPTENLVLGQVLKGFLKDFLDIFIAHTHVGNMGYPTAAPGNASEATALKSNPVDNDGILSNIAFTEKGS